MKSTTLQGRVSVSTARARTLAEEDRRDLNDAFNLYYKEIARFAASFVGCDAGFDVASDVFGKLGDRYAAGERFENVRAWLYRAARNACCDVGRAQLRRPCVSYDARDADKGSDGKSFDIANKEARRPSGARFPNADPVETFERDEELELLREKALKRNEIRFSEHEERAFRLCFGDKGPKPESPSLGEIAEALDVSVCNARNIRVRMFAKLQKLFRRADSLAE